MNDDPQCLQPDREQMECASINSSPLFIMVAESTLILAPISQLGCRTAWAGVAAAS